MYKTIFDISPQKLSTSLDLSELKHNGLCLQHSLNILHTTISYQALLLDHRYGAGYLFLSLLHPIKVIKMTSCAKFPLSLCFITYAFTP